MILATVAALAALGALLLGVAATGIPWDGGAEQPPDVSGLTVDDVYARMVEAARRPGHVFHQIRNIELDAGPLSYTGATKVWVDAQKDVARQENEFVLAGETHRSRVVIAGGARYEEEESAGTAVKREAAMCRGTGAALALVVDCPGPLEEQSESIESGDYHGRPVVVLAAWSVSHGSDETWTMMMRIYLDPETFLPIAAEGTGTLDTGEAYPATVHVRYRHDFIPASSLASDFFDPASIGYVERDPEGPLQGAHAGIDVYWLGRDYAGSGGLPPLTLVGAYVPRDGGSPYDVALYYGLAEDQFKVMAVDLQEFDLDGWNSVGWGELACGENREMTVQGRRVILMMGFQGDVSGGGSAECPAAPYNEFEAHVFLGETVVFIVPVDVCRLSGCVDSPYNSIEGIEALAAALTLRE